MFFQGPGKLVPIFANVDANNLCFCRNFLAIYLINYHTVITVQFASCVIYKEALAENFTCGKYVIFNNFIKNLLKFKQKIHNRIFF